MAKKKSEERRYLSASVPGKAVSTGGLYMPVSQSEREYTQTRMAFAGIDRARKFSGGSRDVLNMSFREYPAAVSVPKYDEVAIKSVYDDSSKLYLESIHGFDDFVLKFYWRLTHIEVDGVRTEAYRSCVSYIKVAKKSESDSVQIPIDIESPYEYDDSADGAVDFTKNPFLSHTTPVMDDDITSFEEYQPGSTSDTNVYTKTYEEENVVYEELGTAYLPRVILASELEGDPSTELCTYNRSIVVFNVAINTDVITDVKFNKRILVYPDNVSLYYADGELHADKIELTPTMTAACAHAGRIFGVDDEGVIYASCYNSYADFTLDTPSDISAHHAWMTHTQVDEGYKGGLSAVVEYNSHVLAFGRDRFYTVYNTSNPFRALQTASVGTVDGRSVCTLSGRVFFLSDDGVYTYDGSSIERISDGLGVSKYTSGVAVACDGAYYLYSPELGSDIYVYDTESGMWSRRLCCEGIVSLTTIGQDVFAVTGDGMTVRLESDENKVYGEFLIETSEIIGDTLKGRRVKEVSLLCEADENSDVCVYIIQNGGDTPTLLPVCEHISRERKSGIIKLWARLNLPAELCERIRICGHGKVKLHAIDVTHTYI